MASKSGKNGKVKISGASKDLEAAARAQAAKPSDKLEDNVRVVKEQHTRLAEPGEGPETQEKSFETKVELGPDKGTHTRLATPADPEARKIHEETMKMRKETGAGPVEKVQNSKDLPNEGDSPREKRAKQQAVFDKADEAGKAEIIADNQRRGAALGGGF